MSVKVYDLRETSGFYGVRLFIQHNGKPYQKYFSFRENGKIVSKARQKAIYNEALRHRDKYAEKHGINSDNRLLDRTYKKAVSKFRSDCDDTPQPIPIRGINLRIETITRDNTVPFWSGVKINSLSFDTYAPSIEVAVTNRNKKKGGKKINIVRFKFKNRKEFVEKYAESIEHFCKITGDRSDFDELIKHRPSWPKAIKFIRSEAQRKYGFDPFD